MSTDRGISGPVITVITVGAATTAAGKPSAPSGRRSAVVPSEAGGVGAEDGEGHGAVMCVRRSWPC